MNPNMLSFDEACERLLGFVRPVREVEEVDTMFAAGRVLAVDQHSTIDQPPMDNSGMDGYALRAADVPVAGTRLPVSQRIPAGSVGHELTPGQVAAQRAHRGDAGGQLQLLAGATHRLAQAREIKNLYLARHVCIVPLISRSRPFIPARAQCSRSP